jgi:hypothetical protein
MGCDEYINRIREWFFIQNIIWVESSAFITRAHIAFQFFLYIFSTTAQKDLYFIIRIFQVTEHSVG